MIKIINNHTYIDKSDLPIIAKSGFTRNNTNNLIKFVIPYAKTVTYQSSYFIRSCKTWNVLSSDLRNRDIGLYSFKSRLKSYYKHALSNTFDLMRLSSVVSCLATLTLSLLVNNVIYNVIVICIVMLFMGSP